MTHVATFLLSLASFALLMLGMARHQRDWLRRKRSALTNRALRLFGFAALALALAVAGAGFGWAYGALVWFGWLTVAAALVVAANTNRDRLVRRIQR